MAQYEAKIAPFINIEFVVTSQWWEQPRNHRGLDIATYSSAGTNVPVYSMCNGTVVYNGFDDGGYGNYIIMKDSTTNMGFLYGHLRDKSPKNIGDSVSIGEQVGIEGTTGHSTRNSFTFRNARFNQSRLAISSRQKCLYKSL